MKQAQAYQNQISKQVALLQHPRGINLGCSRKPVRPVYQFDFDGQFVPESTEVDAC